MKRHLPLMSSTYFIDYYLFPQHRGRMNTHRSEDPNEFELFLGHLLGSGSRIAALRIDAESLSGSRLDKILKTAAEGVVFRLLQNSLGVDGEEIQRRFGVASGDGSTL